MATLKITKMLNRTGEDFCTLFSDIECAENKGELEKALQRFNEIMRILFVAAPDMNHNGFILDALKNFRCSERFESYIESTATVKDAIIGYKTEIVKKLNVDFQRREELLLQDQAFDKAMLACYTNKTNPETQQVKKTITCLSFPQDNLTKNQSENHKLESANNNKKRKLRDDRNHRDDKSRCLNYRRGICRRGSKCRFRH